MTQVVCTPELEKCQHAGVLSGRGVNFFGDLARRIPLRLAIERHLCQQAFLRSCEYRNINNFTLF